MLGSIRACTIMQFNRNNRYALKPLDGALLKKLLLCAFYINFEKVDVINIKLIHYFLVM